MFSVDNFYDYLSTNYTWPRKNGTPWAFRTHGSRNIADLQYWTTFPSTGNLTPLDQFYYLGRTAFFDQEPLMFDQMYYDAGNDVDNYWTKYYKTPAQQLVHIMSCVNRSIICHSEINSNEIKLLTKQGFLDVHYWYHGLIARDWFRHWKHYIPVADSVSRFGCYIRDTSGTRKYRSDLLDFVRNENIYCPLLQDKVYNSKSSAILEWDDTGIFDIHLVAETLFDTSKTHLTEKVLKPVAMEQPFILFAGPNSLQYMRDYGFQTFGCCWDESYDTIQDSQERYHALLDLIQSLNRLPKQKYERVTKRARLIAKNNREHFYSQQFEDTLLDELHNGFEKAYATQKELFFTDPGGMYFRAAERFLALNDSKLRNIRPVNQAILKYINAEYPEVAKKILKQYPNMF